MVVYLVMSYDEFEGTEHVLAVTDDFELAVDLGKEKATTSRFTIDRWRVNSGDECDLRHNFYKDGSKWYRREYV